MLLLAQDALQVCTLLLQLLRVQSLLELLHVHLRQQALPERLGVLHCSLFPWLWIHIQAIGALASEELDGSAQGADGLLRQLGAALELRIALLDHHHGLQDFNGRTAAAGHFGGLFVHLGPQLPGTVQVPNVRLFDFLVQDAVHRHFLVWLLFDLLLRLYLVEEDRLQLPLRLRLQVLALLLLLKSLLGLLLLSLLLTQCLCPGALLLQLGPALLRSGEPLPLSPGAVGAGLQGGAALHEHLHL
mmetsp:Transcript_25924/g.61832  ORF Transcript_25924/g.61832 Transcript_25924/m.61832 type:complete len:244 (-) Transcript_25924:4-735(-)